MTEEGRHQLAEAEAALAEEELRAMAELLRAKLGRVALTRAYFALFHAVRALLYAHDLEPRPHRGTLQLFSLHFVRRGTYEPEVGRLFARLQKYREEADYGAGMVTDDTWLERELATTRTWVDRLLNDRSNSSGRGGGDDRR